MKHFLNLLASLLGLFAVTGFGIVISAPIAFAGQNDCAGRAADIIRQAYPTATAGSDGTFVFEDATITLPAPDSVRDDPHAVICRIWPAQPELMLVAVALMTELSDTENEGDIELLMVDSTSLKVKQRLRLEGLVSDDAVRVTSVAFDTARYQLAPGKMAFGLRIALEGSSRPNPFGETTLWLFAIDNDRLKTVLDNIAIGRSEGEWDTMCAGEFHETIRTLSMESSANTAVSDILVSEKVTTTVNKAGKADECNTDEKVTTGKRRVLYEGSQYNVPKDLKRF
ncbi:hypothetical protein [Rhizobium paranaense]|uniref:Uncharacterized protein n=1 Tax=Rhizobium paranaense TaxID=1650438 RepID=A0A7W9D2I1_9HYPH|nr:hypothetical protein [Rhizobium paranaense]MBB5575434.1 hypothetical protein [Rhizobium paranaense]